ncbi:hypothetical protein DH2020_014801 [Rehmannia glutinosa]|uniref:MADS-box domain-containing protein n=1 Tax=Rehmannia glutinosa TaxID=99300 RepID=A0ABR0WY08_REHGL
MTRKRIKHQQIPNETKRNATFAKRAEGFLKKANEFSILCGVETGIVVHKHGEENNTILWPSPATFREMLQKFMNFPNMERSRRVVTLDKFMEQTVDTETGNLIKSKEKAQLKESQQLLNQLISQGKSFDELDLHQLNCLSSLSDEMLKKLQKRGRQLYNEQRQQQQQQQQQQMNTEPSAMDFGTMTAETFEQQQMDTEPSAMDFGTMGAETSSSVPTLLDDLRNDQWFIESMSEEPNFTDFLGVSTNAGGASSSAGGGVGGPTGDMSMSPPPSDDNSTR